MLHPQKNSNNIMELLPLDIWELVVQQNDLSLNHKAELTYHRVELLKTKWSIESKKEHIMFNNYNVSEVTELLSSQGGDLEDVEDAVTRENWYVLGENCSYKGRGTRTYTIPEVFPTKDDTVFFLKCPASHKTMYMRMLQKDKMQKTLYEQEDCIYIGFLDEEPFCGYYLYETVMRPEIL